MKVIDYNSNLSIVIIFLMVTIISCDSFLETPPQGKLSEEVLSNEEGLTGNLAAAYSMLDGWAPEVGTGDGEPWPAAASNWVYSSVASDNAHMGANNWNPGITATELYQWQGNSEVDAQLNMKWRSLYEGINRANSTITLAGQVEVSEEEKKRIEGEALFLRAHYYFEAWKMWKNVPYITTEVEDRTMVSNTEPVIPKILDDLNKAIELMPGGRAAPGRVDKWVAKAYKGRVQIYAGDYQGGLGTLREVVNSGPFELEKNFWQVFSAFNDNGTETILAYQASVNDGDPNGTNGKWLDRLNFPHSGSPFGCCGTHMPSQNLVNAFKVDGEGLPLAVTQPDNWNNDNDNFDADEEAPVDPRLDWTVGRDGVPYLDWGKHESGWIRARANDGPYSPKKNIYEKSCDCNSNVGWSTFQLNSKNLHLYRYADLLLLLAEAEVEAGSLENARSIVNQIRTRAGQAAQGPTNDIQVSIDDSRINWANYEISTYDEPWTSKEFARRAVRFERRLELAMEGHRLFDLRRWELQTETLNNYVEVEKERRGYLNGALPLSQRHSLYPIPTRQIDITPEGVLSQNPGW